MYGDFMHIDLRLLNVITKHLFENANCTVYHEQIGHVRFFNILAWLRGFPDKLLFLVLFSLYPSLLRIDNFTVVGLVTWPVKGSKAGVDLVLIIVNRGEWL